MVSESRCRGFLPSEKMPLDHDGCRGLNVSVSRCPGVLVPESGCRGFFVLESRCRVFFGVLESRCRGICVSTASFSLLW